MIARHGKPVVQWNPPAEAKPARRISVDDLRAALAKQPMQSVSTAEIVRQQCDEGY